MSKLTSTISHGSERNTLFVRVWAGFGLLLFASTWKLWTPQSEFPQIPFFEFLVVVPGWVDWIALVVVGLSLSACLLAKPRTLVPASLWLFGIGASVLILLNQHRLQPWAYQFVVFAIIMASAKPKTAFFWMRWIVISVYLFSAISKFDYQFIHTVGDRMLWSLGDMIGIDTNTWTGQIRNWIVFCFPVVELVIGLGLSFPKTRRIAVVAAVLMHISLLLALVQNVFGYGVLIWNLFFVFQVILLFGSSSESRRLQQASESPSSVDLQSRTKSSFRSTSIATIVATFVLVFPLTQPLGICDHWPAWQVYSPRSSRAKLNRYSKEDLLWTDIPSWSGQALQVPVYPQARFQLTVAMAVQAKFPHAKGLSIEVSGESNRWTGAREAETLTGDQVKMYVERYWLNVKPRSFWMTAE